MKRIALFSIGTIIILFTLSKLLADERKDSESAAIRLTSSVPIATSKHFTTPFTPRRVIHVCKSGCDYKVPSQAVANGEDYDLILVQAGTYADCAAVPPSIAHVWIRGFGGMAHLEGVVCERKAAFVVTGVQTVIENFEFSDLHIACEFGQNAVGIRLQAGDLLVHNSYFHDSQGGILTANTRTSNIAVSNSHFARLGKDITQCASNPFTWFHNIYIALRQVSH
jgi:hypothetical protein